MNGQQLLGALESHLQRRQLQARGAYERLIGRIGIAVEYPMNETVAELASAMKELNIGLDQVKADVAARERGQQVARPVSLTFEGLRLALFGAMPFGFGVFTYERSEGQTEKEFKALLRIVDLRLGRTKEGSVEEKAQLLLDAGVPAARMPLRRDTWERSSAHGLAAKNQEWRIAWNIAWSAELERRKAYKGDERVNSIIRQLGGHVEPVAVGLPENGLDGSERRRGASALGRMFGKT